MVWFVAILTIVLLAYLAYRRHMKRTVVIEGRLSLDVVEGEGLLFCFIPAQGTSAFSAQVPVNMEQLGDPTPEQLEAMQHLWDVELRVKRQFEPVSLFRWKPVAEQWYTASAEEGEQCLEWRDRRQI